MSSEVSVRPEVTLLLDKLRSKQIEPAQLQYEEGSPTMYGSYGSVRKAKLDNARVVAVKALQPAGDPEDRARLILRLARELANWEPMSHPNILPLTGFYVSEDHSNTLLVSPWAEGGHIQGYIEGLSPDLETRIGLALDTAAGLKFLHDKKICHTDLKPTNVVVLDSGCAVLCDFPWAKAIDQDIKHAASNLTTTIARGNPPGTALYLSPESVSGLDTSHTLSSDIWAWGCLLLEILTGIPPYASFIGSTGLVAIGNPPADALKLPLPSDLRIILLRCWNVSQADRPTIDECFTRLVTADISPGFIKDGGQLQNRSEYQQVRVLFNSQRLQMLQGDSLSATEALGQAKEKLIDMENSFGAAWCDSTLASVHGSQCQYSSSRVLQEKVFQTFEDIGAVCGVASSRYELGVIDSKQGQKDAACALYREALKAFQQQGDLSGAASCLRALGDLDHDQGQYQDAETQFQAALGTYQQLDDQLGLARCRLSFGTLNLDRGNYGDANGQLQQALETFQRLGDHFGIASCHQRLGKLSYSRGRYDEARRYAYEALGAFKRLGNPSEVAWCQRSLCLIDCALKKYDDAKTLRLEALESFQRLDDQSGIASCYYDLGIIALGLGKHILAQRTLLQALDVELRLGDLSGVAYCRHELGKVEYELFNYDKARMLFVEALEAFQSMGDVYGEAGGQRGLGLIDYEQHNYDDARTRFQKAIEAYGRLGDQSGIEFCHEGLRKIEHAKLKDSKKMIIHWP